MKPIKMFTMASCPYCGQAEKWMQELSEENPAYGQIPVERIDETLHPEIAAQHDYYYVPTFYVGNEKLHEGVATKEKVKAVFDAALG